MKSTLIAVLFACFLSAFSFASFGQAGTLDSSFGNRGKVTTTFADDALSRIYSTAIQPDGKIIAGGNISYDYGFDFSFILVRYYSNGAIDSSFGTNGIVETNISPSWDAVYSIALQSDGRIIAGGAVDDSDGNFVLVRYYENGEIDSSFGKNGIVGIKNRSFFSQSIAIQGEDKIIIGGWDTLTNTDFSCMRLLSNGKIDSSFGLNGKVNIDFNQKIDFCYSITLQPDDKIILGGCTGDTNYAFALTRVSKDGQIDSTFGNNGRVTTKIRNYVDAGNTVCVRSDGKILLGGESHIEGNVSFALACYQSNGHIDSSFAKNGISVTSYNNQGGEASSIAIQSDKKILLSGMIYSNDRDWNFGTVRYNSNGSLDTSYGDKGTAIIDFDGGADQVFSSAMQKDGNLIVAGASQIAFYHFALARLNAFDNSLPITLFSFSASKNKTAVLLKWQTASEQNNSYFLIERSNNGKGNFNEIGRVNSKGNSNQLQQYSFEDLSPFSGGNYYRLKQVDKDRKFTYSKTVFVDFDKTGTIKLYPNPVKDIITLDGLSADNSLNPAHKTTISIIDIQGRVLAKTNTVTATYSWSIKQLPAGTYYVRIEADKKVVTLKFVKE